MDRFRTTMTSQAAPFSMGHSDRLLLVGSCFTEHMGDRLSAGKFSLKTNPFGIVYNPASIVDCLERLWAGDRFFNAEELFEHAGLWRSWEHHSAFAGVNPEATLAHINNAYRADANWLRNTNRLLLTLGTADVFLLRDSGQIVANNHKMQAARFEKSRLTVAGIADSTSGILQKIKSQNPDLQVVLTVSPVRHMREGAVANQRSKATLVLACEEICRRLPFAHYFPSYELLLDDLRDYRFYAKDMIHPSELAVDYIWEHFAETYFTKETRQLVERIGKIQLATRHKPFQPDTPEHRAFRQAQLAEVTRLQKDYPELDLENELAFFRD